MKRTIIKKFIAKRQYLLRMYLLGLSLFIGGFQAVTFAQPGATCTNPIVISSLPFTDAGNTSTYGNNYSEADVPTLASGAITNGTGSEYYLTGDEVVYAYTPTTTGTISISTTNDNDWIGLWAFTGCPFSSTVGYHTSTSGATRSIPDLPVTAGTTYYFVISTWAAPQSTDYTIEITGDAVDYCVPAGTNSTYYLDDFSTTGGTTNISNLGSGYSTDGYGDFTATHTLTAAQGTQINFTAEGYATFGFRIWIDYNQDGVFDPVSEVVWNSGGYLGTQTGNFYISPSAPVGTTRMRVVYHWLNSTGDIDPCETNHIYGEFEDYTLVITQGSGEPIDYCIPAGTNSGDYIDDFSTTGGVQNVSNLGTGYETNGYGDYTSMVVEQNIGDAVNFNTEFGPGGTYGFRIWVDWNQDGIFSSGEVAWASNGYAGSHSGSFTVPASATLGATRMRIANHWLSTTGDVDPCSTTHTYGEFEDYTFIVAAAGSGDGCTQTYLDATFGTNWEDYPSGAGFSDGNIMYNDIVVDANDIYTVQSITIYVMSEAGNLQDFELHFLDDDGSGGLGTPFGPTYTFDNTQYTSTYVGNMWGMYDVHEVVFTLPNVVLNNSTNSNPNNYWVGIASDITTTGNWTYWIAYSHDGNPSEPVWQYLIDTDEVVRYSNDLYETVMIVDGTCGIEEGCEWTVHVWGPSSYGDEVEWELREGGSVILSGGSYGYDYDVTTSIVSEGPVELYVSTAGIIEDNIAYYELSNENGVVVSGVVSYGAVFTSDEYDCDDEEEVFDYDCDDQVVASNNLENGYFVGTNNAKLAVDVIVGSSGFTAHGIEVNMFEEVGETSTSFDITLYSDATGLPGGILTTTTGTVVSTTALGQSFGYDVNSYILTFSTPLNFNANTTYWVQVDGDAVAWEATSASVFGSYLALNSDLNGNVWTIEDGDEFVYRLICDEVVDCDAFTASITGDVDFCAGDNVTLTASASEAGSTFEWGDGSTGSTLVVNTAGTYTVTATSEFGCEATATITVNEHTAPTVDLGADVDVCEGETVTLESGNTDPTNTVLWSDGSTGNDLTVSASGTYSVTVTNSWGCEATSSVNVTFHAAPTINLGGDIEICDGGSAVISSGNTDPNATVVWSNGLTGNSIVVTTAGTYSVTITSQYGCVSTGSIEVTINAGLAPEVDLGGDVEICEGESVTLESGNTDPTNTVVWSDGSTGNDLVVTTSGTYSVTITNTDGCSAVDQATVTVHAAPVVDLGGDVEICDGGSIILSSGNTDPNASVVWSDGSTDNDLLVTEPGTYSVTVTSEFGCSATDQVTVSINTATAPSVDLGADVDACEGESVTLESGNTDPTVTVVWSDGSTDNDLVVTTSGTYSVTVTNSGGCSVADQVTVTFHDAPTVTLPAEVPLCEEKTVTLDSGNDDPNATVVWSTGATGDQLVVTEPGTYTVTITNEYGCESTGSTNVVLIPLPSVDGVVATENSNGSFTFSATGVTNANSYSWDFGDGNTSTDTSPTHTYATEGTYTVTVTVSNECGSESYSIEVEYSTSGLETFDLSSLVLYPNPTRDNVTIENGSSVEMESIVIYNSVGQKVFNSNVDNGSVYHFNVHSLATGLYHINIFFKDGNVVQRKLDVIKY